VHMRRAFSQRHAATRAMAHDVRDAVCRHRQSLSCRAATLASSQPFWAVSVPLLLLLVLGPQQAAAASMTQPADAEDDVSRGFKDLEEANRKQGYAVGTTGEYFRYTNLFYKSPSEDDRAQSLEVAAKIRCDVCLVIVDSLLTQAKSFGEDDLADVLEGHGDYEESKDPVRSRMLEHKKGCNKHFKDELISEGYVLRQCKEVIPGREDSDPCLFHGKDRPNQQSVDSYDLWKEGLFHACEQSVAHHSDAIAEYLSGALHGGEVNRTAAVRTACETVARCGGAAPPTAKAKAAPAAKQKQGKGSKPLSKAETEKKGGAAAKKGKGASTEL